MRVGALAHANRNLVDSQWRRRQLLDRTVRVAEEERARIAANLHDGPIQRLAALGLVLDRCRLRMDREDKEGARDLVKRARTELSEEIRSLRQLMSELRPPILDEGGLEAALRDHLRPGAAPLVSRSAWRQPSWPAQPGQRDRGLPGGPGSPGQRGQAFPGDAHHGDDVPVRQRRPGRRTRRREGLQRPLPARSVCGAAISVSP